MATRMWNAVRLPCPCLSRPKCRDTEERQPEPDDVKRDEVPSSQHRKMGHSIEAFTRPKVSLDKVRNRCSNILAAAARYHHRDVEEDYKVSPSKILGEGCSGKVVVATSRVSGRKCALKSIKKDSVG